MIEPSAEHEQRLRVLVVEDDYLIATDLALALEDAGLEVVGPAGSVKDALELVSREGAGLDVAVLDINLGDERVYPVADALVQQQVRFIFVTGYDQLEVPEGYLRVARFEKPVEHTLLIRALLDGPG